MSLGAPSSTFHRRPLRSLSTVIVAVALQWGTAPSATAAEQAASVSSSAEPHTAKDGTADGETTAQADAKARYQLGVEAYRQRRYEEAIQLFLAADGLAPRAALAFNVARAYEKLEEPSRALQYYRDYLRRGADASNRDEVERRVRELQAALAERGVQQVTVRSKPTGATVSIDGRVRGTTPWTGELPIGSHQLQAQHPDSQPVVVALNLEPSRAQDLELALPSLEDETHAGTVAAGAHGSVGPRADEGNTREEATPSSLQPWPWVALGAGGATLVAAGVFELLRRGAESDAQRARYQPDYYDDHERMASYQTTARVLIGVSAAFALSGGILALIDGGQSEVEPAPVAFACTTSTCVGTWMGNF